MLSVWILAKLESIKNQKWGLWESYNIERGTRGKQAEFWNYGMVMNQVQHDGFVGAVFLR